METPGKGPRIGIIGAGPGGIASAVKLKQAGFENFTLFEKGTGVGGTWWHNRYPGLSCDVPSHLYSFSFHLRPIWSRAYAPQPEILAYMQEIAEAFGIMRHVRLSTEVLAANWDRDRCEWHLTLGRGVREAFDIVISAQGMFNGLRWPDIPGRDSFEGILFHSARWPSELALAGKTVAVIGTAASAVQFVPRIAPEVGRLQVYQRSPSWVLPKDDPVFDAETLASRAADPAAVRQMRDDLYREMDSFCDWASVQEEGFRLKCLENMAVIEDPDLRRRLTPNYPWACARPLFSNEYYPTFNRRNVELVTDGIREITPRGIVDNIGWERPADIVICATGYQVDRFLSAIPVTGEAGLNITGTWANGPKAYLGIMTSGFPNMFMLYGPNTNNGSLLYMIERQIDYIVRHIRWMEEQHLSWIDVRREVMDEYDAKLQADIADVNIWTAGCHNYYRNATGRNVTQYPHNMTVYTRDTSRPDWDAFDCGRREPGIAQRHLSLGARR